MPGNHRKTKMMPSKEILTIDQLIEHISQTGLLPLLNIGIDGWSADDAVDEECRYHSDPEEGWEWKLWEWKGPILLETGCAYGKFFEKKAGFITREWWPDFSNYRRSRFPYPASGSIEEAILETLKESGSLITRDLRQALGFTGTKMRGKFDGYLTKLEMAGYIVTEDFVYPKDRHGKTYGWGWSLLTTPERLFGKEALKTHRSPQASYDRLFDHLSHLLPDVEEKRIARILG